MPEQPARSAYRPLLIDGFCRQGGASEGFHRAGFDVIGIDLEPQPRYPFEFHQGDVMDVLPRLLADLSRPVAAIAGGPPCQLYSKTQRIRDNDHPDLIGPFRELCITSGLPYIIENVEDARPWLRDPVMLCGAMFPSLRVYRHRMFESSVELDVPEHPVHVAKLRKMGRQPLPGEFMHCVGNFTDVEAGRRAMGISWMTREGLREAIPPAYTEHLGQQLMAAVTAQLRPASNPQGRSVIMMTDSGPHREVPDA